VLISSVIKEGVATVYQKHKILLNFEMMYKI